MALILSARDGQSGLRYSLPNGESVIGRRPDCDLVLDAPSIASRHARVFCVDGRAVLRALAAEHPVYVNGAPADRHVLVDGDEIQLAHYRLRFVGSVESGDLEADTEAGDHSAAAPDAPAGPFPAQAEAMPRDPEAARPAAPGAPPATPAPTAPAHDPDQGTARAAAHSGRQAADDLRAPSLTAWVWGSGGVASPPPATVRDPAPEVGPRPETAAGGVATAADTEPALPPRAFHLDILSGINQGRRVTLTHERVILGFDRERLVEIRTTADELRVRRIGDQAEARLNGEPISDASTTAAPGDVLSVQRIDMRIHRDRRG